jgi:crossover junction endodeoxyribonuclease RusA
VPLLKRPKRIVVQLAFHLKNPLVGDADNLGKACLDGLNGIAYDDDCQVTMLKILKVKSTQPRTTVIIQEIL